MTSKTQAFLAATVAAVASLFNWLATVPPSQQEGMLAQLVDIVPVSWRPNVGVATRLLMFVVGIYATYKASHSGPQTPPANPPQ